MPAKSEAALARKVARRRERRAELRAGIDALKVQKVQEVQKPRPAPRLPKPPKPRASDEQPFTGCDGEGLREPDRYALFRMGERELYAGDRRLTTPELLAFIAAHPAGEILVAFAFEYDVSNILRDVPHVRERPDVPSRLERILQLDKAGREGVDDTFANGGGGWTWLNFEGFPTFGVSYIPRNFLRVCVADEFRIGGETRRFARKGSTRTIFDTFGFFQSSFLAALGAWDVGKEHRERIKTNKDARAEFSTITAEIKRYCAIECDLLARMMTAFRQVCLAAGIRPKTWNGAGKLAAALHGEHGTIDRKTLDAKLQPGLVAMAHAAYYGGRFETTRRGHINETVYERDINSAYPAAMLELPCLEHGRWIKASAGELRDAGDDGLFVAPVRFTHPRSQFLCGLPIRAKDGRLSWPRDGLGVYWSAEIRSAERLGATCELRAGWLYESRCDCRPFHWIEPLYRERKRLESIGEKTRGVPIKLGLNSLYGKLAQRIGKPKWQNPIYAGLITALTRAKLNNAILSAGERNVVMLATDAIFTIRKAPKLKLGGGLGQWDKKRHRSIFIVRPGLYWPPKPRTKKWKLKTRGLSIRFFEPCVPLFRKAWRGYARRRDLLGPPIVPVPIRTFVSLRLAFHLNRIGDACKWIDDKVLNISFNAADKRGRSEWSIDGRHEILHSLAGTHAVASVTYDKAGKLASALDWEDERMWLEALPDPIDLAPPFID